MKKCYSPPSSNNQDPYRLPLFSKCKPLITSIDPLTCQELAALIRPTMTIDFEREIYAIIPFLREELTYSLIIYHDYCSLLPQPPFPIIKQILLHYHFYDYGIFKDTLYHLFSQSNIKRQYKLPCATSEYSLLPLTNATKKDTIWVNPGKIMALTSAGPQLFIELQNQLSIPCSVESRRLKQTMLISFLAHGVLKREHSYQLIRPNTSLTEFLELSYSPITNHLLENFCFHDLPGKRGSFSLIYQDLYAEVSQQRMRQK
jgi:hypothetical protein